MSKSYGILAVGNFDSNEGYAWRLMERFWCELAKIGASNQYELHLTFPSISTIPEYLLDAGFHVHKLDFSESKLHKNIFKQLTFVYKNKISAIYFTDQKTLSLRYILFRLLGVKTIIIHDHTPGIRKQPGRMKSVFKRTLNKLPLCTCTAAFGVSPYVAMRLEIVNCVPKRKISCITNGIPSIPLPKDKSNYSTTTNIITVSRATYYKGIDFALRTIQSLVYEHKLRKIHYTLLGDGPNIEDFKELSTKLGISEFVNFAGSVNNVSDFLLNSDIAFHPSRGEAMSLAILEYMRAGLPVVASDNPSVSSGLSEYQDSLIYEESNISDAATKIRKLIENPDQKKSIGDTARLNFEEKYTEEMMLETFRVKICEILGPKS